MPMSIATASYTSLTGEKFVAEIIPSPTIIPDMDDYVQEDMKDPFFTKDEDYNDALHEVSFIWKEFDTVVVRCATSNRFFAKIHIVIDPKLCAIRAMYLYCAGWRRREREKTHTTIVAERSAIIVWKLCLTFAKTIFGPNGCIYIMHPRNTVFRALQEADAALFECTNDNEISNLIHAGITNIPATYESWETGFCARIDEF